MVASDYRRLTSRECGAARSHHETTLVEYIKYIFRRYRNMSLTYADVGSHIFGEREFKAIDLARRTGNPRAAKILSELVIRGVVTRTRRGYYKFLRPAERPDLRAAEWTRVRDVVLNGPAPKAWDGSSAVEAWTGGRYTVSPSVYARVFHLAVPNTAVALWREYLSRHAVSTESRKRVGARVELRGVARLHVANVNGEPVIPRSDVLRLIREHPGIYANAEELLVRRSSGS